MTVYAAEPLIRWEWIGDHTDDIRDATIEHLQLTGSSVAIGFVIAMAMAMVSMTPPTRTTTTTAFLTSTNSNRMTPPF